MSSKKFERSFLKCFESYLLIAGFEEDDEVEAESEFMSDLVE